MARPKKTDTLDTAQAIELTAGAIERLTCRTDTKAQAFLRDTKAPGLRVRVSNTGSKSFVFESKLNRQTIRRTIGDVRSWTIEQARTEANRLRVELDNGRDPREIERQQREATEADNQRQQAEQARQTITGLDAWADYLTECKAATKPGHPDQPKWGARTLADHITLSAPGGVAYRRKAQGSTQPGPLHGLLNQPLALIDSTTVAEWLKAENTSRPTQAALAFRLLRAFLNWCAEHPTYSAIAIPQAHSTKAVRNHVAKQKPKTDALQREHLPAWFAGVLADTNPHARAYLVGLLLTGSRAKRTGRAALGRCEPEVRR